MLFINKSKKYKKSKDSSFDIDYDRYYLSLADKCAEYLFRTCRIYVRR